MNVHEWVSAAVVLDIGGCDYRFVLGAKERAVEGIRKYRSVLSFVPRPS